MNINLIAVAAEFQKKLISREDKVGQGVQRISVAVAGKDEVLKRIEEHLAGELRLGLYNLLPDGTVRWAVVEFENHGDKEDEDHCLIDAVKYQKRLGELEIPSLLERSKNPNGQCYHLHIAFDQALPARDVREGLRGIGRELFGTFANEIFPKSDSGLGHFVWLPLFGGVEDVIYMKPGEPKRGGGVGSERTVFVDADGIVVADQEAALRSWVAANADTFSRLVKLALPAQPVSAASKDGTGIALNQPGLVKMEAFCPVIKQWIENPSDWLYDRWLGIASNYVVFKGGWERFVEISKQDTNKFEQSEIDRIREEVLAFHGPQTYERFRDQGLVFELPDGAPKAPAGWASKAEIINDPIVERDGCYGKYRAKDKYELLSPFVLDPLELLELPDGDVLNCRARHVAGRVFENVTIENTDWHTRQKLMKAMCSSECTFHGSDADAVDLCRHVISNVPVRKQGTRMIGLIEDLWVVQHSNLSAGGRVEPMKILPYDRSSDSLHSRVIYKHVDDLDYGCLIKNLFNDIFDVNLPEVMLPILGWFFAAPLKPKILDLIGSFPILFCYGTPGGGKTTLMELMLSMFGYADPTVYVCTMKQFPTLKLLSSTNAVPVVMDEYKPWDMRDGQVFDMKRVVRKIYRGEIEDKGNPDQTVTHYVLSAPLVLCGESKVNETAVLERVLIAGFTDEIKRNSACRTSYSALRNLDLQSFTDRYIVYCLNQDLKSLWSTAETETLNALNGSKIDPRPLTNMVTMTVGLKLMQNFAKTFGIDVSNKIDLAGTLKAQIEEITGNFSGQVKLAVDLMLEQFALLAERGEFKKGVDYTFAKIRSSENNREYLCLRIKNCIQYFRANAKRIGFDGEILDEGAYMKQLKAREYCMQTDYAARFQSDIYGAKGTHKTVRLDLKKAISIGLVLDGFEMGDDHYPDVIDPPEDAEPNLKLDL